MQDFAFRELPVSDLLEHYPLSRQVGIRNFLNRRNQTSATHRHTFYTLELITEGSCTQYINGFAYECAPGSICLMSPFDYHYFRFSDEDVASCCVSFTEDVLAKEVMDVLDSAEMPCFLQLQKEELDQINGLLQILESELSGMHEMYLSMSESIVNQLMILLLRSTGAEHPKPIHRKSDIRYSIPYIRRHFRESLTLVEVAEAFNVTQNHFCKYFKKITGITFKEYLLQLRLEYAVKQIRLTQDSITDICFDSGFNSPSYFAKAFKQHFGCAPTAFRGGK